MSKLGRAVASVVGLIAATALTACGGGGGDSSASTGPTAEGVYGGTLTGSTSNAFNLLVLENGEFWAMYGTNTSNTLYVRGFVQGSGTSSNGVFSSTNAKDFGFTPALAGTVNATYNATTPSISGTVASSQGSVGFSGGTIAGSLYTYNTPASLSTISGSWSLTSLTGEGISLSVATNGAFTATSSGGCSMSGTVAPRASGKNVFNLSLTFGAAPCALSGQTASGIAVAYPLSSGGTQLVIGAVDSTRTYGAAAFGTR